MSEFYIDPAEEPSWNPDELRREREAEIEEAVRKLQEAVKEAKTRREGEIARREMAQKHKGEVIGDPIPPVTESPLIDWNKIKFTPQVPMVPGSDQQYFNHALVTYAEAYGKPPARKYETVTLVGGQEITAHTKADCQQQDYCCIHNPSNHPLRGFRQLWRNDRNLMERVCSHGVGHPDPDDLYYKTSTGQDVRTAASHGCDGCC